MIGWKLKTKLPLDTVQKVSGNAVAKLLEGRQRIYGVRGVNIRDSYRQADVNLSMIYMMLFSLLLMFVVDTLPKWVKTNALATLLAKWIPTVIYRPFEASLSSRIACKYTRYDRYLAADQGSRCSSKRNHPKFIILLKCWTWEYDLRLCDQKVRRHNAQFFDYKDRRSTDLLWTNLGVRSRSTEAHLQQLICQATIF